jgi:hypothetical protein
LRLWDVSPGYLNRLSLLGEHRELHGLANILMHGKKGYSRHPETLRWVGCLSGLARRHACLAAEMRLRGYQDRSPLGTTGERLRWPAVYVTTPSQQFALLRSKYEARDPGRIPLPTSAQELWAQHKYSVMARDPSEYRSIGRRVGRTHRNVGIDDLATQLVKLLRLEPPRGRLACALEHLWGYVRGRADPAGRRFAQESASNMLDKTQELAVASREPYLMSSTALSDLAVFLPHARRRLRVAEHPERRGPARYDHPSRDDEPSGAAAGEDSGESYGDRPR